MGRTYETDSIEDPAASGESVQVQGRAGRIEQGPKPDSWVVTWNVADSHRCGCTQYAVVAASGATRNEVLRFADAAEPMTTRPRLPSGAIPDGLRSLGTLVADNLYLGSGRSGGRLTFDVGDAVVTLENYVGDPRIAPHMQFWKHVQPLPYRDVAVIDDQVVLRAGQRANRDSLRRRADRHRRVGQDPRSRDPDGARDVAPASSRAAPRFGRRVLWHQRSPQ